MKNSYFEDTLQVHHVRTRSLEEIKKNVNKKQRRVICCDVYFRLRTADRSCERNYGVESVSVLWLWIGLGGG